MEYLNLISIPAIATAVYLLIEVIKKAAKYNEKLSHFYPLIGLALGIVAGVICYYFIPNIIPASNVVIAMVVGGASGLSATGTNQIFKQINKSKDK